VNAAIAVLLVVCASMITWIRASTRWRARASALEATWSRVQAELLDEMSSLQDEAARARTRSAQLARDAATWAAGYKQGCNDMIKAVAALHGDTAMNHNTAQQAVQDR
jgi:hypothetical protein